MEFISFPKVARLSREIVVTEKIDGTNACIAIDEDGNMKFGSRTRWITPQDDNYGFAAWAEKNRDELLTLGPGRHFGEWWGAGIQRSYGLSEKRFSLFNIERWGDSRPACCHVVPILYKGPFGEGAIMDALKALELDGSAAVPGFMRPEGVMIWHSAGRIMFKKTIDKDSEPKGANSNE